MNLRRHARTTAWLGLMAMWLVVCVPLISQLVIAARADAPIAPLCSAVAPADAAHHGGSTDPLSACGYCDLLATHAAMPSVPPAVAQPLTLTSVMIVPVLSVRFTPLGAFPSGRPRAPPFVS